MLRTTTPHRRRAAFTLVELMVAAAVCVLIMAILATAFSLGIDTFRDLKAVGDMMGQLRGAETVIRQDLAADHFLNSDGRSQKLSSFRFDQVKVIDRGTNGPPPRFVIDPDTWKPPVNGFFRIRSDADSFAGNTPEGADADQLRSGRYTTHYLHFTSILGSGDDDDYFRASAFNTRTNQIASYHSTAAEISYSLEPILPPGVGPQMYRLIRRQRLLSLNDTDRRDRLWPDRGPSGTPFDTFSFRTPPATGPIISYLNTLAEITHPANRLGGIRLGVGYTAQPTANDLDIAPMVSRPGEDTLLSNVLSFEVQVKWTVTTDPTTRAVFSALGHATPPAPFLDVPTGNKTDHPFDTLPMVQPTWHPAAPAGLSRTSTFDTWTNQLDWVTAFNTNPNNLTTPDAQRPPLLIRVQAIQLRLRVWDPKHQTGRQITIIQEL